MDAPVRIWDELVELQTYGVGAPDANPMFLEQRVYQGSSGAMYPLALIDKVLDEPRPEPHRAVFLENRYLKVMVLPGLGGRVHMALDKTNGYAFVYHNHVIKPALVGLAGPWISGGIEFNWPQHHRPSTYEPLEWTVETHGDGSMTVWCGEIERMSRMKGAAGFTLHPDKAVLEVRVRMQNRMPYAQSFLWWANPAVHANDDYQSVFPPDVHGVFDHGRRDVSEFPIARGTYYKVDYSAGVDISRWRNIPVPTSYMAAHSDCDFLGGYDHGRRAGMLHVADHHLSPGKKQWVWGNGEFGLAWDRQLTDADGPYLELMAGVYTDNQPDFTWIQPFESKTFSQYFLPYKEIGYVRNASADFLLSLALDAGQARVGVYATGLEPGTGIRLTAGGEPLAQWTVDLDPERPFLETVELPAGTREEDLRLAVLRADGVEALGYQPAGPGAAPALEPACPVQPPADLPSCEQLYLTAQHLEQYRHATVEPMPYYQEALRREPGDSRCSTALGLLLLKRGRFREAEGHFRAAVATLTRHNANPAQGEAHFHLGHALLLQGRDREACDALSKAAWCAPVKDAAHTLLAQLDARRGQLDGALRHLDLALERNSLNYLARGLRAAVLRRLGRDAAARDEAGRLVRDEPLDHAARFELALLDRTEDRWQALERLARRHAPTILEVALPYAACGFYPEALRLLGLAEDAQGRVQGPEAQLVPYYRAWFLHRSGAPEAAASLAQARAQDMDGCFPNRLEDFQLLDWALAQDGPDPGAGYALGNWLYARREHARAVQAWEGSRGARPGFPTVWRNLGLAAYNRGRDGAEAVRCYREALRLDPGDARILFELDQLEKLTGTAPAERLRRLDRSPGLVAARDDLSLERAALLNLAGRCGEALALLEGRLFHPWEGAEGKVTAQYALARLGQSRRALAEGRWPDALAEADLAMAYPPNLGEARLAGMVDSDAHFHAGLALGSMAEAGGAAARFEAGAQARFELSGTRYYNDQPPEMAFYGTLCLAALGREETARERFQAMAASDASGAGADFFAVSRPEFLVFEPDPERQARLQARFISGLGQLGLGRTRIAGEAFRAVLAVDPAHAQAQALLQQIESGFWARFVLARVQAGAR
jgi:tetratricopeptide (TPR) repeat protein